jgi:beta-lactamase superfamily II metal-dependent hydrolase
MKKIIIPLFLLSAALITAFFAVNYEKEAPVQGEIAVHFIDVGQGMPYLSIRGRPRY